MLLLGIVRQVNVAQHRRTAFNARTIYYTTRHTKDQATDPASVYKSNVRTVKNPQTIEKTFAERTVASSSHSASASGARESSNRPLYRPGA